MNRYRVTYYLEDDEKQVIVEADNTGDVFSIVEEQAPDAYDIKIEQIND